MSSVKPASISLASTNFKMTYSMKKLLSFGALLLATGMPLLAQTYAIRGETVHTMSGEAIRDGVVLVKDGKIERVGPASRVTIPSGYTVTTAKVVTPGFIDAHTVVGLSGYLNQTHDQDQLDRSSAFQPELRAIDAYNPRELLVEHLRVHGITTIHTGHAPGALASGQTMIVKTSGETLQEALVDSVYSVAFTLGTSVSSNFSNPGSRSRMMAMMRGELLKAQEYAKNEPKTRDLRMEILGDVLSGKVKAMITAHRATEIQSALRLQREFGFEGYVPKTRVVHFEAGVAAANGLPVDVALRALTINAARFLGVQDRVGSLEAGKDADIALFDGDPLEYLTRTTAVMINGKWVSTEAR